MSGTAIGDYPAGHPYLVLLDTIQAGEAVLDVGCGSGAVGALLRSKAQRVDGIEPNASQANLAAGQLDAVVVGLAGEADPPSPPYDSILFIDVVEHVPDVPLMLKWAKPLLNNGGRILALIPNGAHLEARKKLVRGDWSYDDQGLFDRTHIHFYDVKTIGEVPGSGGFHETRRWYFPAIPRLWPLPRYWTVHRWPNLFALHVLVEWRVSDL